MQFRNAVGPIRVILSGITMETKPLHPSKVLSVIVVNSSGNTIEVSPVQFLNAVFSMLVIWFGRDNVVKKVVGAGFKYVNQWRFVVKRFMIVSRGDVVMV